MTHLSSHSLLAVDHYIPAWVSKRRSALARIAVTNDRVDFVYQFIPFSETGFT